MYRCLCPARFRMDPRVQNAMPGSDADAEENRVPLCCLLQCVGAASSMLLDMLSDAEAWE